MFYHGSNLTYKLPIFIIDNSLFLIKLAVSTMVNLFLIK